jgi:hypothetical protein
MKSPLAAIPAMIELSLPAGFTPADSILVVLNATFAAINSDSPACSANAIHGTNPAHDTKRSSSNIGIASNQL